jgi:hypothetical protein
MRFVATSSFQGLSSASELTWWRLSQFQYVMIRCACNAHLFSMRNLGQLASIWLSSAYSNILQHQGFIAFLDDNIYFFSNPVARSIIALQQLQAFAL